MNEIEGRGGDPLEAKWVSSVRYERRKHDKVGAKYEMKTDNKNKQLG